MTISLSLSCSDQGGLLGGIKGDSELGMLWVGQCIPRSGNQAEFYFFWNAMQVHLWQSERARGQQIRLLSSGRDLGAQKGHGSEAKSPAEHPHPGKWRVQVPVSDVFLDRGFAEREF